MNLSRHLLALPPEDGNRLFPFFLSIYKVHKSNNPDIEEVKETKLK